MSLLDQISMEIEAPLRQVDYLLQQVFAEETDPIIRQAVSQAAGSGGKRIRPMLTLLSARLFSDDLAPAIPVAVAAELIHLATLIHDDVIDNSDLRRHQPTLNKQWGNRIAVLAGDSLLSRAITLLVDTSTGPILRLMMTMMRTMCEGEIMQFQAMSEQEAAKHKYLGQIERKTAQFFRTCCECGALAVGATNPQAEAMGNYGLHVGMAYQIIDDLLDFVGDPQELGKPVGADYKSGLFTLPLLYLLENKKRSERNDPDEGDWGSLRLDELVALLRENGAVDYTVSTARGYATRAKAALEEIPENPIRYLLAETVDELIQRSG